MKLLVPITHPEPAHTCLRSLTELDPANIIVVDNSLYGIELDLPYEPGRIVRPFRNIGVARAWNIGIRDVLDGNDMTLTVCSQSITFGPNGVQDLYESIVNADEWGAEYDGFAWHINTFTRKFMHTFGFFDENFYPAYMEDTDALYRMGLLGIPSPRENGRTRPYFDVDATCAPNGQALRLGVQVDFENLRRYYRSKWGGNQGHEEYRTAFDDNHGVNWWPGVRVAGLT